MLSRKGCLNQSRSREKRWKKGWRWAFELSGMSVHHSGKEDEFMASEIHPWQGVFTVNINIRVRATARATLDKPTAVNYELACREGDRLVNMQSRRSMQSPCNTSVRPPLHLEWQGLTRVSITRTSQATGQILLGINPKNYFLTHEEINFLTW